MEQAVALTLEGHPDKPSRLSNLGRGYSARWEPLGDLGRACQVKLWQYAEVMAYMPTVDDEEDEAAKDSEMKL